MQLAKIIEGELVTTFAGDEDREMINTMVSDGFKIFVDAEKPATELTEFQALVVRHREDAHQITAYHEIVDNDPQKISAEIERLKSELSSTDYKIIKSYELTLAARAEGACSLCLASRKKTEGQYTLAGEEPPYDISALHHERQWLRDKIGELEIIKTV